MNIASLTNTMERLYQFNSNASYLKHVFFRGPTCSFLFQTLVICCATNLVPRSLGGEAEEIWVRD